jgi:acyl carrier protein
LTREEEIIGILSKVLKLNRDILEKLDPEEGLAEYNLSSVVVVELIVELESHFGIAIDDNDLLSENVSSIRKINQLVNKYLTQEQSMG